MTQTHSAPGLSPDEVLFPGEKPFPVLPAVDHYCGSEKLMKKAMAIQAEIAAEYGPLAMDITCDCEDGAAAGNEKAHAELCVAMINSGDNQLGRVGARIHDVTHDHWQDDLEILVGGAGKRLPFITLPKPRGIEDVRVFLKALRTVEKRHGITNPIPAHVPIETHGALHEVWDIAALDGIESLDFGLMDFVSGHFGAIPGSAMKSPGQFDHPLVRRAKLEIASAALGHGKVPSHNVTTELSDLEYIRRDADRARQEFGYLRMWSIHPVQIRPILDAMSPDYSEVQDAAEIITAAADANWGPIRHNGKLQDRAAYRYYWTLLKRARSTGVPLPAGIAERFFAASN